MNEKIHQPLPAENRIIIDPVLNIEDQIVSLLQHRKTSQVKRYRLEMRLSRKQQEHISRDLSVVHKMKCWFSWEGDVTIIKARAMDNGERTAQKHKGGIYKKTRQNS